MEEVRRIKKNRSYDRRSAGRDLRPGLPEYKTRVPPTGAQQRYDGSKENTLSVLKVDHINKLYVRIQSKSSYSQSPL